MKETFRKRIRAKFFKMNFSSAELKLDRSHNSIDNKLINF